MPMNVRLGSLSRSRILPASASCPRAAFVRTISAMAGVRDYNAAIEALNSLQTNFTIVNAIRKSGSRMNEMAIPEMIDWCRRTGYEPKEYDRLNIIHIAGTKGKGSTSAMISSILGQCGSYGSLAPKKIGLYTSPHLRSVRERIQINGEPISEELFARYFFEIWDRLDEAERRVGPQRLQNPNAAESATSAETSPEAIPPRVKPVYFRYLTLMAFHTYLSEGVDTAVFECGIGGEHDSTNVIVSPSVTAVTSLGIDHTAILGETIDKIAWHKAGIFKKDSRCKTAFTVASQPAEAMQVLRERAEQKGLALSSVAEHNALKDITLGLAGDFQRINASVAIATAAAHLRNLGITQTPDGADIPSPGDANSKLPAEFQTGLETAQCGGRCETRQQGDIVWHLDGGHTMESIRLAASWFGSCIKKRAVATAESPNSEKKQIRVLLFNQQTRDAVSLAKEMYATLREIIPKATGDVSEDTDTNASEVGSSDKPLFDHAVFCTNVTFAAPTTSTDQTGGAAAAAGRYKPDLMSMNDSASDVEKLTVQRRLAETWDVLDHGAAVAIHGTIEEAIKSIRKLQQDSGAEVVVLVTGSLHLVGGVLEVLDVL